MQRVLLILVLLLSVAKSSVLYVSPSGNSSVCSETSPCSIAQSFQNASSGSTIYLMDGYYLINSPLNVTTPNLLVSALSSPESVTISSTNLTAPIFTINQINVTFSSLSFTNIDTGLFSFSESNGIIQNCNIISSSGTCINADSCNRLIEFSANGSIINSNFVNCSSNIALDVSNSLASGALIFFETDGEIINATFTNTQISFVSPCNAPIYGSLIYFGGSGHMSLCSFLNSSAILSNCSSTQYSGELSFIFASNLEIDNTIFDAFAVTGKHTSPQPASILNAHSATIESCQFSGLTTSLVVSLYYPSLFAFFSGTTSTWEYCTFSNITLSGLIYNTNATLLSYCSFQNLTVSSISSADTLVVQDCQFSNILLNAAYPSLPPTAMLISSSSTSVLSSSFTNITIEFLCLSSLVHVIGPVCYSSENLIISDCIFTAITSTYQLAVPTPNFLVEGGFAYATNITIRNTTIDQVVSSFTEPMSLYTFSLYGALIYAEMSLVIDGVNFSNMNLEFDNQIITLIQGGFLSANSITFSNSNFNSLFVINVIEIGATIYNCTFTSISYYYSGFMLSGSIDSCSFYDNRGYSASDSLITSIGPLTISNSIFTNNTLIASNQCMGLIYSNSNDSIENCTFTSNVITCPSAYASNIYCSGPTCSVHSTSFVNNKITDSTTNTHANIYSISANGTDFTYLQFIGNSIPAIVVYTDEIVVDSMVFLGNTPQSSLLNFVSTSSEKKIIAITNCTFIENILSSSYGFINIIDSLELTVDNCYFHSNQNLVLLATEGLNVTNSNFTNNIRSSSANQIDGGLIVSSAIYTEISNCSFTNNLLTASSASCRGGVIFADYPITISATSFRGNSIQNCQNAYGSVLYTSVASTIHLNSEFLDNYILNTNNGYGGAIYSSVPLSLDSITFTNNSIFGQPNIAKGGALYLAQGVLSMTNNSFIGNSLQTTSTAPNTQLVGGAIYIDNVPASQSVNGCTFSNNGISFSFTLIIQTVGSLMQLSGSTIYVNQQQNTLTFTNSTFTSNYILAPACPLFKLGGGVLMSSGSIIMADCHFEYNSIRFGQNSILIYGGVLYSQNVTVTNSTFVNNTVEQLSNEDECVTSLSNAINGGCIFGRDVQCTDVTFQTNSISGSSVVGGVISSNSTRSISTTFLGNHCEATGSIKGGTLFDSSNSMIDNTTFMGNVVLGKWVEGGIAWSKNTLVSSSIMNANSIGNSGSTKGGGMYSQESIISQSSFTNNQASGFIIEGSALWSNSSTFITSSVFANNSALSQNTSAVGGAIWVETSNISFNNSIFSHNSADFGGVYSILSANEYPIINNSTMSDNLAFESGSDVFIIDNLAETLLNCYSFIPYSDNNTSDNCGSIIASLNISNAVGNYIWPSQIFSVDLMFYDWFSQIVYNPNYEISIQYSPYFAASVKLTANQVNETFVFPNLQLNCPLNTNNTLVFTATSSKSPLVFSTELTVFTVSCPPSMQYEYYPSGVASCVICGDGTYNFNGSSCVTCPSRSNVYQSNATNCVTFDASVADDNELLINAGWWPNDFSGVEYLIPCFSTSACYFAIPCEIAYSEESQLWTTACRSCNEDNSFTTPESTNCYCGIGHENRLCAQCVCNSIHECYYPSDGICEECSVYTKESLVLLILGGIGLIVIVPIIVLIPKSTFFWITGGFIIFSILSLCGLIEWYYSSILFILLLCYFLLDKKFPPGITKCLFYFLQLMTTIVSLQSWPPQLYGLVQSFAITNLDISFLACFIPFFSNPLYSFVLFNSLVHLFIILCGLFILIEGYLSAAPFIVRAQQSIQKKIQKIKLFKNVNFEESEYNEEFTYADLPVDNEQEQDNSLLAEEYTEFLDKMELDANPPSQSQSKLSKVTELIFTVLNAAYFPVALMNISVLSCEDEYMILYPWISCSSSTFYLFVSIAAFVIFFFVAGYPVVLFIVLFLNRCSNRRFKKIFQHYRDSSAYFELVFILQKLFLVIFITLLSGFAQQLLVVIITVSSVFLYHYFCPFQSKSLNHLLLCCGLVIVYSYIFSTLNDVYSSYNQLLFVLGSWLMASLVIILLLLFLLLILRSHWFFRNLITAFRRKKNTIQ